MGENTHVSVRIVPASPEIDRDQPIPPSAPSPNFYFPASPATRPDGTPLYGGPTQSPVPLITVTASDDSAFVAEKLGGNLNGPSEHGPESWLPITQSRKGNTMKAVFHIVSSGIGAQGLLLPLAFASLGWGWGVVCLAIAFAWQLYTIWLLVGLHESPYGPRYSRFLQLSIVAFGKKLGKLLAIFPVMYLSGGSSAMTVITGGGIMDLFFQAVCGDDAASCGGRLGGVERFLVFACAAFLLAQFLPNLNAAARVSAVGAVTAVAYYTLTWALFLHRGRDVDGSRSHASEVEKSNVAKVGDVANALGIIALCFRGHNVVLEIQGTLPSDAKRKSHKPMWRAVLISYTIVAMCLFPFAIVGHWAYGDMIPTSGIPTSGGLLSFFLQLQHNTKKSVMAAIIVLLVLMNNLTSIQIYAMVVFDNLEFRYISKKKRPCPWWLRRAFRALFGGLAFFVAVAFPFLGSLAPLIGGIVLPLTFVYPCFMWNSMKRPRDHNNKGMWALNLGLGLFGIILSIMLVAATAWNISDKGIHANFFKP
ncbi:lysine histidine transporter-like 7 [Malania oleifera]|uniref:lysine histidine transporter-like 7 n=1 Tax=Malania oleifera TaxID=397392 RepID=UPI0025ADC31A|nr:lysine histidine transporter-like 7 [Malania oleifera]